MILDSLNNRALYYGISPRMQQAFEWIVSTDWNSLEAGTHELDGKAIFANVMDVDLKRKPDAKLEIHDRYIDIQVLISGEEETFGWSERRDLKRPLGPFDAQKDILFSKAMLSKEALPHLGQEMILTPFFLRPRERRSSTPAITSSSISPVIETRSVSPMPSFRRFPRAHVLRTADITGLPASVTPMCWG